MPTRADHIPALCLLVAAALGGCGEGSGVGSDEIEVERASRGSAGLAPGFADGLGEGGGCGDAFFYTRTDADDVALLVRIEGLATRAHFMEEEIREVVSVAEGRGVTVFVQVGARLTRNACTDDLGEEARVDGTWLAVSGSVTASATPTGDRGRLRTRASVLLEDVILRPHHGGGPDLVLERFEFVDVTVGWMPG